MMRFSSVVALFPDLPATELVSWVERGWVRPEGSEPDWVFQEIDVARVRLIHDFGRAMAVPDDTMPLVLSLLDQLYHTRDQMRRLRDAMEQTVPDEMRARLLQLLRDG